MARSSGRSGAGGRKSGSAPAHASSSSSSSKKQRNSTAFNSAQAQKRRDKQAAGGPTDITDVYDYAVAQTDAARSSSSATSKKDKSSTRMARRAMAGMHDDDLDDVRGDASRLKGKGKARYDDDDDDDDDEVDSDSDQSRGPVGPKVFDSEDELNAGIEGSDEEIDSDEAFGESDDEKYGDFKFASDSRKRPSKRWPTSKRGKGEDGLDSDEDEEHDTEDQEDDDGVDGDMMDLSRMLESGSEGDDDKDDEDGDDESEDDDDEGDEDADERLRKHIDALAAQPGSKRSAADPDDDQDGEARASKRSRKVLSERTEAVSEGEFATAGSSGPGLRLEDFLDPLSGQVDFADVRKSTKALEASKSHRKAQVASQKGGGALSAPLPAVLQDKLDRQAAYKLTKDEVQGWAPTIKQIREADHLSFPLQKPQTTKPSTAGLVASFQPSNELESEIAGMLEMGGMTEKQLAEQEDLAMNKLDPEEVKARRAELRRMRDLMFRAEQKAKRVKKIKSKAYRKVHRKERERLQAKMRELGISANGEEIDLEDSEGENADRLRAERDRAMERATLKHKNTSKWAKHVLGNRRGEEGQDARDAIEEQLRRGEQLRRRIQAKGSDSDGDGNRSDSNDSDDDYDERDNEAEIQAKAFDELATLEAKEEARRERDEVELEAAGGKKGLYNMKFMKDAREREAKKVRGMVDDFKAEMAGLVGEGSDAEGDSDGETGDRRATAAATFVGGNKGRAIYGAGKIQSAPAAVDEALDSAPTAAPRSKAAKSNGADHTSAGPAPVEVGGSATKTLGGRKKTQGISAAASASINPFLSDAVDGASADADSNPWLAADAGSGSGKLSSKKNAILVGKGSSAEAKAASRMKKDKQRGQEALDARREDEEVEIDLSARLDDGGGRTDDSEDGDDDDEPTPVNPSSRHPTAFQQRELVSQAFAGDDVQTAFVAEKAALVASEAPQEIDTSLPGWGSWGGKGVRAKKKKRGPSVTLAGLDPSQRKDASMAHVIINEKKDKKAEAFRVKDLPRPFTSRAQYEMAMRNPLGPEWNTRVEHQRLNMPRVTKKLGKVIKPIERKF